MLRDSLPWEAKATTPFSIIIALYFLPTSILISGAPLRALCYFHTNFYSNFFQTENSHQDI